MSLTNVQYSTVLIAHVCPSCGIPHAIPQDFERRMLDRRGPLGMKCYCPNGHSWHFTGESDAQRLKRELEREQERLAAARRDADHQRAQRKQPRRYGYKPEPPTVPPSVCAPTPPPGPSPNTGLERRVQQLEEAVRLLTPSLTMVSERPQKPPEPQLCIIEERQLRAFMTDYLAVCQKHGMEISTTEDGGQSVAYAGSNISDALMRQVRDMWPLWDYESQEHVSAAEAEILRQARIVRDQERAEWPQYERLKQKYGE